MTRDEAEDFIGTYRVAIRRWTLMLSGMADGDPDATRLWIEEAAVTLEEIGDEFPDLSVSTALLRGLRVRRSFRSHPRTVAARLDRADIVGYDEITLPSRGNGEVGTDSNW